jgi:hypothetical protein
LRHHRRLVANCHLPTPVGSCCFIRRSSERPKLVSILAASSPTCCGIIADFHLRSQALAASLSSVSCCFLESSVRPLQGLSCGIMSTLICAHKRLRLHCRSLRHSCRLVANCHLPTPVGSCCFIRRSSERPKLVSILAASSPTFICAHRRLRLHCRLTTSLSFIAALMPTCG